MVRFCLAGNSLCFHIFLGKDPFVEVAFDLVNPSCFLMRRCEQLTLLSRGPTIWSPVCRWWRERFVCACGQSLLGLLYGCLDEPFFKDTWRLSLPL